MVGAEQPVVGWRYWQVSGSGRLRSVTKKWIEWEPGKVMRSTCLEVGHASPAPDCNCGLYAIDGLDRLREHGLCLVPEVAVVAGRVALWGRVVDDRPGDDGEADDGSGDDGDTGSAPGRNPGGAWRGELGRPVALSLVTGTLPEPSVGPTLAALAAYQVPVDTVSLDEAVAGVSAAILGFQAMSATTAQWAQAPGHTR